MKFAVFIIAVLLVIASVVPAGADGASRPVVIVFGSVQGEGADKALTDSSTKAVCSYLRDTQRVEVTVFNRESPTVLRAIMEKQLTADQVASYSSQQERILVAKALSYDYAAGAEVSVKNGMVQVKLWMAKSAGGKRDRWEATTQAAMGGGATDLDYDNAMQSATSASVINVARQAFGGLPAVDEKQPTTGDQTTAIGANLITPPAPPSASDYVSAADASLKSGSFALAIQQYQQAVNADPSNAALRLKLADAFARKGMYDEASAELGRAATLGASVEQVAAAKNQIEDLRAGQGSPRADTVATSSEPVRFDTVKTGTQPPKPVTTPATDAKSALSQMREGDKLWRASKPDEAADAYKEAIKLNPADWRAYERLALVYASMSMFAKSRNTLEQLAKLQPVQSPKTISDRYELFSRVFEQWFTVLFNQYDRDSADYQKRIISRESYYSSTKGLGARLESMARFLDALPVPDDRKPANLHRSLACGLVSQAALSLLDYLETNNAESKSNAETFVAQAKKELEAAAKLQAKPVIAAKPPEPEPAPAEAAPTEPAPAWPVPGWIAQPEPGTEGQDTNSAPPDDSGQ